MQPKQLTTSLFVSQAINVEDVKTLAKQGIKAIICNRPDDESPEQTPFRDIEKAANEYGITTHFLPVIVGQISLEQVMTMARLVQSESEPTLAYCRTGTRSTTLWACGQVKNGADLVEILSKTRELGFDIKTVLKKMTDSGKALSGQLSYDIVIVGGGAAGIATAASLLKRTTDLSIAIIEPSASHYYQPGWTMVGAGIFEAQQTEKPIHDVIPFGVKLVQRSVTAFDPDSSRVLLDDGNYLQYSNLIVAAGIKLDWSQVEGLNETLGENGVTSNYRFDLAPYTFELVRNLKQGNAIFTQPPMPIKCAGAPQKAMYLSADHWLKAGHLNNIKIDFCNAGAALFGVKEYVAPLMEYVEKYQAQLNFSCNLVKVDGRNKEAWFEHTDAQGNKSRLSKHFDMLHVCPPQTAPDFIKNSTLADDSGWIDVDKHSLQHTRYENIWALGDVTNTPNAKTAAAARAQAPVVANNVLKQLGKAHSDMCYYGYGSCPLTVENGKVLLAEFGYEGKLMPTFPKWVLDGTKPSRLSWMLKKDLLPEIYWQGMLKGREWLVASR